MCIWVKSGKFLGYMITYQGIEANLEKVQSMINMQSPMSVKEVQRLIGHLVALRRFMSKLYKTKPYFFQIPKVSQEFPMDR